MAVEPKMDDVAPAPPRARSRRPASEAKKAADAQGMGKVREAKPGLEAPKPANPLLRKRVPVDPSKPPTNKKQGKPMNATHEHVARTAYAGAAKMETETHFRMIVPKDPQTIAKMRRKGYVKMDLLGSDLEDFLEDDTIVVMEIPKEVYDERYRRTTSTLRSWLNEDDGEDDPDADNDETVHTRRMQSEAVDFDTVYNRLPDKDIAEGDEDDLDDEDNG